MQIQLSFEVEKKIYRVSELNDSVQKLFSRSFTQIWIAGEVSGCRLATSGHYYFCLKDSQSQLKCVLFKSTVRFGRVKPQDGLSVLLQGSLEVYQPRGEYQFIVERLELQGTGALQLAFEALKTRLGAEGLFDAKQKKALPQLPQKIGLITSPSGAVLQDILQVLNRRFPGLHIRLFPSQVQGEGSVEQLCAGLQYFSALPWAEVVILARGGGSLEDLWSFNDERVARAIAASKVPIISAVGHETDFTIADFVADYRAPTPSVAAEIVIRTRESLLSQFEDLSARMTRNLRYTLAVLAKEITVCTGDGGNAVIRRVISRRIQQVDEADQQLGRLLERRLDGLRRKLAELDRRLHESNLPLRLSRNERRREALTHRLGENWQTIFRQLQERLVITSSHLVQLSPLAVLGRGYAIVENPERKVLRSADETAINERLSIRLHSGRLKVAVVDVTPPEAEGSV